MVAKRLHQYSRRIEERDIRKRILIVTEGATEAEYFKRFKRVPGPKVIVEDGQDNKRSLVERTIARREELIQQHDFELELDTAWVVFDRDTDVANKKDLDNFNQAIQIADNSGIHVAWSNDCFELWFLLHFQDVSSGIHRTQIYKLLAKHLGSKYEKARGGELYAQLKQYRAEAIRRAEKMHNDQVDVNPADANPCSTVYMLVKELLKSPGFRDR